MKYTVKDLDKKYTEIVRAYLDLGLTFYSPESSGSQGEEISTYLTDGSRVIVIYMNREMSNWNHDLYDTMVIKIGEAKNHKPYGINRTVWLNELQEVESFTFYRVSYRADCFTDDIVEAKNCFRLHMKRSYRRECDNTKKFYSEKAIAIALAKCKKTRGYKTNTSRKDIECVVKDRYNNWYIKFSGMSKHTGKLAF